MPVPKTSGRLHEYLEDKWTHSIAVGSKGFVESVKSALGIRAKGMNLKKTGMWIKICFTFLLFITAAIQNGPARGEEIFTKPQNRWLEVVSEDKKRVNIDLNGLLGTTLNSKTTQFSS